MEIKEAIAAVLKELVVPEINSIREENREIKAILTLTNKRLDDVNLHLVDQSRRIDETNRRIDDANKSINAVWADMVHRFDETNKRMDRLYEVIVRREEHVFVTERVAVLEREVSELKRLVAA